MRGTGSSSVNRATLKYGGKIVGKYPCAPHRACVILCPGGMRTHDFNGFEMGAEGAALPFTPYGCKGSS